METEWRASKGRVSVFLASMSLYSTDSEWARCSVYLVSCWISVWDQLYFGNSIFLWSIWTYRPSWHCLYNLLGRSQFGTYAVSPITVEDALQTTLWESEWIFPESDDPWQMKVQNMRLCGVYHNTCGGILTSWRALRALPSTYFYSIQKYLVMAVLNVLYYFLSCRITVLSQRSNSDMAGYRLIDAWWKGTKGCLTP